jgi:glycosyltransferase involved in cell wall biosynthesis
MTTLTLIMIVKNESSIITRCLDSIKSYIDHIVISDTGSTDNTVEIINNYLIDNSIPGKVFQDDWKNFGYNRTKSLLNAQEWLDDEKIDKSNNYFITIDADMIIEFNKDFKKSDLTQYDHWSIRQYNSSICYYNSRIFRSNLPFRSIGVTHEYWGCDIVASEKKIETISIDDKGDGGCKSDKFTRDIQLLKKGLENEPDNPRYYFYLAQSYGDINDYDNAIEWYKKRINAGSWYEEVFISYKRIGELYMNKGEEEKAIYYWTLAYEIIPERSETIYKICNYYRNKGKNNSSLIYLKTGLPILYPKDHVLFLEYPIYIYKFLEELSIIGYYVNKKKEGLLACQYLLLNKTDNIPEFIRKSTLNNNFFYINSLSHINHNKLTVASKYPYISSSASLLNINNCYKGVIRAVNYSIDDNFQYIIRDIKDIKHTDKGVISTINYWAEYDNKYNIKSFYEIDCRSEKLRKTHIIGLEDVRICIIESTGKIYGLAVDWEHGRINHPSVILLNFELENGKYIINKVLPITYNDNICQKNWALFSQDSKLYALYSHHPLIILEIDVESGQFKVIKEKYSKYNLIDVRGSSNPLKIGNEWIVLVHEVVQKNTRKYYHRFLKYSNDWELIDISEPFYFKELYVEFSLSIMYEIFSSSLIYVSIVYSSRDNTTEIMTIDYSKIPWLPRDIKKYLIDNL